MMAELPPARVVEFLGGIPPGEVRCLLARVGGLGGRGREGDPDPVDVGSGPVPRSAVRLVALEAAIWEGGRGAPTAEELARESGLSESTVDLALEVLGRLLAAAAAGQ